MKVNVTINLDDIFDELDASDIIEYADTDELIKELEDRGFIAKGDDNGTEQTPLECLKLFKSSLGYDYPMEPSDLKHIISDWIDFNCICSV